MGGPWEDFGGASDDGPWADFKAPMATPQPDTLKDIAKSAGMGTVRGIVGLSTLPGNLEQLARAGINKAADFGAKLAVPGLQNMPPVVSPETALPTAGEVIAKDEAQHGKWYQPQTTAGQYAQTAGEFLPGALAGGPEVGLGTRLLNVAGPAAASETAGQLTKGTVAEPWARAAAAIFGNKLPSAAMSAASPLAVNATRAKYIANLENQGVTALTAGQKTGSKGLRYAESASADSFLGGSKAQATDELQRQQFTRAALAHAGIDADEATSPVIDEGFKQLGSQFDAMANHTTVKVDQGLLKDINQIRTDYKSVPSSLRSDLVEDLSKDILAKDGQTLPGQQYQTWRSTIDRAQRVNKGNPTVSNALSDIRDALDAAMQRSMSPLIADAWKATRGKYRNLLAIEKAVSGSGENTALGFISPSQLRTAVKSQNTRAYVRGQRELGELARSGEAVMRPLPNSGTAARANAMHALSAPGAIAGGVLSGFNPVGAALGAVAPAAMQGLTARMVMSAPFQKLAGNQMMAKPLAAYNAGQSPAWLRALLGLTSGSENPGSGN